MQKEIEAMLAKMESTDPIAVLSAGQNLPMNADLSLMQPEDENDSEEDDEFSEGGAELISSSDHAN